MKKKTRRLLSLLLALALLLACTGCGAESIRDTITADDYVTSADTTTSPEEVEEVHEPTQDELWPEEETEIFYCYYEYLSPAQKSAYRCILGNVNNLEDTFTVELNELGGNAEQLLDIYEMVIFDHPEIFWVDGSSSYADYSDDFHGEIHLSPNYIYDAEEVAVRQEQLMQAELYAMSWINYYNPTSQYDCVRRVFEYVIDTVEYELGSPDNQNVCSSMINGVSVCAGYSKEVQYLLQRMMIPTMYVTGYGNDDAHAWNIVWINGEAYNVDATFGERSFTDPESAPILTDGMQYDYGYLCVSDEVFSRNHTVGEDNPPVPACVNNDLNAYYLVGSFFWDYDWQVDDALVNAIREGKQYFRIQFATQEAQEAFLYQLDIDDYWQDIMTRAGIDSISTNSVYDDSTYVVDMVLDY